MKTLLLALGLLLATRTQASAFTDFNANQRFGESGYSQTDASILWGSDTFSIKPKFSTWKSDTSSGTFNTYSLRLDYSGRTFKAGAEGGIQPKTDGYDKKYAEGDVSVSFYPNGEDENSLYVRLDLGLAAMITIHADEYQLATASSGAGKGHSGAVTTRTKPFELQQRDYTVFWGMGIGIVELSGDYTKTNYNQTILPTDRGSQDLTISGLDHVTQGFLDNSWSAKAKLLLGALRPYVSYTSIRMLDLSERELSYAGGLELKLKIVKLRASYELYKPGNGSGDSSYYGGGATLLF